MPDEFDVEELYDEHAQALYAFALDLTRNEADTRDILQDLFIKVARQPGILTGVRQVRAYLLRLIHNAAIDMMRRRVTRDKYAQGVAHEVPEVFEASNDADEDAFRRALSEALAELPVEQRTVVHLRLWEGMKFEEIAELLELSLNTTASRYRYGIDKLRQRLRPLYNEIK
jgi:RNA polymerase sigma-70 factor (ECF subfamily)